MVETLLKIEYSALSKKDRAKIAEKKFLAIFSRKSFPKNHATFY
jgi:hypothetical protein